MSRPRSARSASPLPHVRRRRGAAALVGGDESLEEHAPEARGVEAAALARQAVPVPGSWYPEDRFMRVLMVKETSASRAPR